MLFQEDVAMGEAKLLQQKVLEIEERLEVLEEQQFNTSFSSPVDEEPDAFQESKIHKKKKKVSIVFFFSHLLNEDA